MDEKPRGIINGERGIADSQERLAELSTSCTLLWLAWLPKPGCSFPLKMGNTLLKLEKKIAESSCRKTGRHTANGEVEINGKELHL